jgi:hypothetical protein
MTQFPYLSVDPSAGEAGLLPWLPLTLIQGANVVPALGLVDTGASVNVLSRDIGEKLGISWDQLPTKVTLSGNLASDEARVVLLDCKIADYEPVRLVFAWTRSKYAPLILGQTNFFLEFDACF